MKIKTCALTSILLSLSACATVEPTVNVTQVLGDRFVGQPVQSMAGRYGVPDEQRDFEGQKVYVWHKTHEWRGSTAATPESETWKCRMDVYVDAQGIIKNLGVFGNYGACEQFLP